MTDLNDLTIPLSAIQFNDAGTATLEGHALDISGVGLALQRVSERFIALGLEQGELKMVSVTFDVTGESVGEAAFAFDVRIDRRTRTLVFASGIASQDDRSVIKATMVYRIA
ncbi:MAG: hypothetical protein ABNH53_03800 [Henriciella sp.]|jgi:hypothetical protein